MSDPTSAALEPGRLLVATPALLDPNFERTVVLMLDVDENGALGVVLNRPSTVPVAEILPEWGQLVGTPDVLFSGGPVSTDSALAVAALASGQADEPVGFRGLYGTVGIVDLDTPTEIIGPALSSVRIFAGYAGWGQGQLEDEIRAGSWYVVPSSAPDLFGSDPLSLWARVLRRQPGELAWVATRPLDPTLN
jgi:putative transcriptional regulator